MIFLRQICSAIMGCAVVGTLLLLSLVSSITYAQDETASIAQGFRTHEANVTPGALVSLEADNANYIELATEDNVERLAGVISEKALIEINNEAGQLQVVTSGFTAILVSDINGEVKNGDKITASPISGIGMKATEDGTVVGTAQADMSSGTPNTRSIRAADGSTQSVKVASIPAQIDVGLYVNPSNERSFLPEFLQLFANSIAGREVSPVRATVAAAALLIAVICIAVLLYSSVRSSIISIGRNPLSEVAVRKGLLQVGLTVVGILLLSVLAIYLILIT